MIIKITPLDTLFFKDGKPFSMGEETWADGIFPPAPSVIYGAIRSAYFAQNIDEFNQFLYGSKKDPTNNLRIKGIGFQIGYNFFLPLPLDCVKQKRIRKDKNKVLITQQEILENLTSLKKMNIKKILLPPPPTSNENGKVEKLEGGGLLSKHEIVDYFNQNKKDFIVQKISDIIQQEPKVGIGRNNFTHSTEEGKLYRVGMNRLESKMKKNKTISFSIIVDFEGLNILPKGFMKLGGEGKAVEYSSNNSKEFKPEASRINNNRFKLYLSTPTIFHNGWFPHWLSFHNDCLEGTIPQIDLKVTLSTAVLGKPVMIGGFDIKEGVPKPMRKAVPQGSIYYFQINDKETDIQKKLNKLNGQSISDEKKEEGFGICFIGKAD